MNPILPDRVLQAVVSRREISRIGLFKLLAAFIILLALISHDAFDPSPFNLLQPVGGVSNLLGLPGALFSGLLTDFLGLTAFIIPFIIVFSGRQRESLNILLLIPELVEILAICSLISLLLSPESPNLYVFTGSWGAVTNATLLVFPGIWPSILILAIYQILYFRSNRIDISFFYFLGLVFLIALNIAKQSGKLIRRFSDRTLKYVGFNWTSPLVALISRRFDIIASGSRTKFTRARNRIEKWDVVGKTVQSIDSVLYKRHEKLKAEIKNQYSSGYNSFEQQKLYQAVISKYRESHYFADGKLFLEHEQEI